MKPQPTRKTLLAAADKAFSAYIRARDEVGGNFRCPTCGRTMPIEQADAGHYISRRFMATRFDEVNVNAQCRSCNRFKEGAHFLYRQWLVEKHGEQEVELLEARAQSPSGFSAMDLSLIAIEYKKKLKAIKEN
jgi:rubredoxin